MSKIDPRSAAAAAAASASRRQNLTQASVALSASSLVAPNPLSAPLIMYYSSMGEKEKPTSLPEDIILDEILVRLPIKLVFRFKCVSKRYNSIIPNPDLGQIYLQRAYSCPETLASSGLTSSLLYPFTNLPPNQNPKDITITCFAGIKFAISSVKLSSVSLPNDDIHKIVGSSNGLILSLFHPNRNSSRRRFSLFVSNPLTKQSVQLPKPPSTKLINYYKWVFGIVAKPLSKTYKIVLIRGVVPDKECVDGHAKTTTTMIFSSDTGSWATWEVSCPADVFAGRRSSFSYHAILHFVGPTDRGEVITYDPFNSPGRFGGLPFPEGRSSQRCRIKRSPGRVTTYMGAKSVIYSGEEEMLRFCEMRQQKYIGETLRMWRLVDYDKGEWCYEREIVIRQPSPICCSRLMVAPNLLNRHVICHPFVRDNKLAVFQDQSLTRKVKQMVLETPEGFRGPSSCNPLIPIDFCPWSSPFYALRSAS